MLLIGFLMQYKTIFLNGFYVLCPGFTWFLLPVKFMCSSCVFYCSSVMLFCVVSISSIWFILPVAFSCSFCFLYGYCLILQVVSICSRHGFYRFSIARQVLVFFLYSVISFKCLLSIIVMVSLYFLSCVKFSSWYCVLSGYSVVFFKWFLSVVWDSVVQR